MRYIDVPETDLRPSALIIGAVCAVEGDPGDSFRLLDIFRDAGGNMIDSANIYGKFFPAGTNVCDQNIGKWLKLKGCRNSFIVTTKGGHPPVDKLDKPDLGKKDVQTHLDESLTALDTECIDLYYLHRDNVNIPAGEIIEYLNEFTDSGKIRYFGCSNWRPERIEEAQAYAGKHGLRGFVADQLLWNMGKVSMEKFPYPGCTNMDDKAYAYHLRTGMPAIAYESQARGLFQKMHKRENLPKSLTELYGSDENPGRLTRALSLCEQLGQPLSAVVLAYLTSQPFPTAALIGPRDETQLLDSLNAADLVLTPEQLNYIDKKHNP